jgi:PST family polysaccharide transporter
VVLPFLVRIIGVENFGKIAFAQAIISYFMIINNFGFNLYGAREVSFYRGNDSKVRTTLWNIIYAKTLLLVVNSIIFFILLALVHKFRKDSILFIFTYLYLIGDMLLPFWFFQGVGKLTTFVKLNVFVKLIYTFFLLMLIRKESHYVFVPLIYSLSQILIGVLTFAIIVFKFRHRPTKPSVGAAISVLKKSFPIFVSILSANIFVKIPVVILGFTVGELYVGYYNAAERIFTSILSLQSQLTNIFYPHISNLIGKITREETLKFISKTFVVVISFAVISGLTLYIFSPLIIKLIYGEKFEESIILLRIFSVLLVVVGSNYVIGPHTLLTFNLKREFMFSTLPSGICGTLLALLIIPVLKHEGAVVSYFFGELSTGIIMSYFIFTKRLNFFVYLPDELLKMSKKWGLYRF